MEWISIVLQVIFAVVGLLAIWGFKTLFAKYAEDEVYRKALTALREGIDKAQEEYVEWHKRASEDGTLDADERKEAMAIALTHARSIADGPVLELIKSWSWEKINSLIKQFLDKKQTEAVTVNVVPSVVELPMTEADDNVDSNSETPA